MEHKKTTLVRNRFGVLHATAESSAEDRELFQKALAFVTDAEVGGKIPSVFDNIGRDRRGRFSGNALHNEIVDISPDGRIVLVSSRSVESRNGYVRTVGKTYYAIADTDNGIDVVEVNKARVERALNAFPSEIGGIISLVAKDAFDFEDKEQEERRTSRMRF